MLAQPPPAGSIQNETISYGLKPLPDNVTGSLQFNA